MPLRMASSMHNTYPVPLTGLGSGVLDIKVMLHYHSLLLERL